MTLVKRLVGVGLLGGLAYLIWKQWSAETAGAAEWLATGEATKPTPVQSIPETEEELAFSDAEEEGWPEAKDPFEGQDPLTAPLPEDL